MTHCRKLQQARFLLLVILTFGFLLFTGCQREDYISSNTTTLGFRKLSEYRIFAGNPSDLRPTADYKLYELSSELFSDYAEKQRLIKLPPGTVMEATDDNLLDFPDGTVIVKTFYYYKDKRNPLAGKKIIETRLLLLTEGQWTVGTYIWNETQDEAYLVSSGYNTIVNWLDDEGKGKVISYHVPSNLECRACHSYNNSITPIGPKVRNLNFDVYREGHMVNQLAQMGYDGQLLPINPEDFGTMPNYRDPHAL